MNGVIVSIVVPVYRTAIPLLERFLLSARRQTLGDIELIAVDDASPDACPGVLDAAAARDPRITVLHRSVNGRAGLARNDGLAVARGAYVLLADADDVLEPDLCATLVALAQRHNADIVTCSWVSCAPDGSVLGRTILAERRHELTTARQRARCCRQLGFALWNKLFRRTLIAPLRFEQFEANIGEDLLFNLEALRCSRVLVTTPYGGYRHTAHPDSATGRAAKGMPYLRTLEVTNVRLRELLAAEGAVGRHCADRLTLKRFATGCDWIDGHPDGSERAVLWRHWCVYFHERLWPALETRGLLAQACRVGVASGTPRVASRLTRLTAGILDLP